MCSMCNEECRDVQRVQRGVQHVLGACRRSAEDERSTSWPKAEAPDPKGAAFCSFQILKFGTDMRNYNISSEI